MGYVVPGFGWRLEQEQVDVSAGTPTRPFAVPDTEHGYHLHQGAVLRIGKRGGRHHFYNRRAR